MAIINLLLLLIFLAVLVKTVNYAIKYSSRLAKLLNLSEFIVSFFIIAFISVLPEATISIISAIKGDPGMGLGTILGSNLVDLTFIFGIVALFSPNGIKVKSKILQNNFVYLILLAFAIVLGSDGSFSRTDGVILVCSGLLFFVKIYLESRRFRKKFKHNQKGHLFRDLSLLILSLLVILAAASFTVKFAVAFAYDLNFPTFLIGITILAIGTCLPELVLSLKAVKENKDGIALGDILGTVIVDATIVLGIVMIISPFSYDVSNLYVTGGALFLAGVLVTFFMKSEKSISKVEGVLLILFYISYVFAEFFMNKII